jgi:hypothetical protein
LIQDSLPWYNYSFRNIAKDVAKANIKAAHKLADPKAGRSKEQKRLLAEKVSG